MTALRARACCRKSRVYTIAADDIYTEKRFVSGFEFCREEPGSLEGIAVYIRRELDRENEKELWYIWMGLEERPQLRRRGISADSLCAAEIAGLMDYDPLRVALHLMTEQRCLVIKR